MFRRRNSVCFKDYLPGHCKNEIEYNIKRNIQVYGLDPIQYPVFVEIIAQLEEQL